MTRVSLSTASTYPLTCGEGFAMAAELGYDGVEVMVTGEPATQSAAVLLELMERHELPVVSIHAPTLLLTARVWGPEPWTKVDRSLELAARLGARTVVVHPPFRWQREYADEFCDGVAQREHDSGLSIAVENMFPWRARSREILAYLPGWDPVELPYDHVTLDLSHTATSGSDAMAMTRALGPRLTHLHLADGSGSIKDEHLVPGRGGQPCEEVLGQLASTDFGGEVVVEVGTRRLSEQARRTDLAESLAFARLNLTTVR